MAVQLTTAPLLEVEDLSVSFCMYDKKLAQSEVTVISNLSITVRAGQILAIAGSSGSGKSLLAHAILGILPEHARVAGKMQYCGQLLTPQLQQKLRGKELALVPQSVAYLDPLMKVGKQVRGTGGKRLLPLQRALFRRYDLPQETETLYPFQLSGGMARRVLVSTAVIGDASLIIADEPTPGMQVEQALEALRHFRELADAGKGVVLITHDIDLAVQFADVVAVFYAGTTVETAPAADFRAGVTALRHPYSKALWQALPQNGFVPIAGVQPYCKELPKGCLFAPRCPYQTAECQEKLPPVTTVRNGTVRCIHAT